MAKQHSLLFSFCSIITVFYLSLFAVLGWDGATDEATWQQMKNEVSSAQLKLDTKIQEAQAAGLSTERAEVSQVVLKNFLIFAQYDRDHPEVLKKEMEDLWWKDKIPNNYDIHLPFEELKDSLEVARFAMAELDAQLKKDITLKPAIDFSKSAINLGNGGVFQKGRAVFPSTFNWLHNDPELLKAFGTISSSYMAASKLGRDGKVHQNTRAQTRDQLISHDKVGVTPTVFFLGHSLAGWMKEKHPETTKGSRHFTRCDPDSPLVRKWYEQLFEQTLPEAITQMGDASRIHLLANEPHFATREDGWLSKNGISEATYDHYEKWLKERYDNDISKLNTSYDTQHVDFNAARKAITVPISTSLVGGPIWYDFCRFNMDRANDWFTFLNQGMKKHDPKSGKTTVKVLGGSLLDTWRDGGIDVEHLADLQDVMGSDLTTIPHDFINVNIKGKPEWPQYYCMEWVEQSIALDFFKSLYPEKPFYDSEWHGLDAKWKNYNLGRDYVQSALWLAFSHGMNMIEAWVWSRHRDGSPMDRDCVFVGEIITQPVALDSFGRTMKELNAHAPTIHELASTERPFRIFYCEEAAIQNQTYTKGLQKLYEAGKMLNLPLGFTTPTKLSQLTEQHTLLIPPTQFISEDSLTALKKFPGKVVALDAEKNFIKTEHGKDRAAVTLKNVTPISAKGHAFALADRLHPILAPLIPARQIPISITDLQGKKAYGVIAKEAELKNGAIAISLINLSKDSRRVKLSRSENLDQPFDLIHGLPLGQEIEMKPYQVELLKISPISKK